MILTIHVTWKLSSFSILDPTAAIPRRFSSSFHDSLQFTGPQIWMKLAAQKQEKLSSFPALVPPLGKQH